MTGFIILSVGLSALALALLISVALTLSRLRIELPANNPEAALTEGKYAPRAERTRPLVLCAGDSLTHGVVSVKIFQGDGWRTVYNSVPSDKDRIRFER